MHLLLLLLLQFVLATSQASSSTPATVSPKDLESLKTTSKCSGETPTARVCTYTNLIISRNEVYCILPDGQQLDVPDVIMEGPTGRPNPRWQCQPLPVSKISRLFPEGTPLHTPSVPSYSFALLAHRKDLYNYFHAFAENLVNLHYHMCKYLKLCEYRLEELLATLLVFLDSEPDWQYPAVQDALKCMSAHPHVLLPSGQGVAAPVMLLQRAVVGQEAGCFRVGNCGPQFKRPLLPSAYLQSWRSRLFTCLVLDPSTEVTALQQPVITYIQRKYQYGRSIINLLDVVDSTRQLLPNFQVQTAYLEGLTLSQTMKLFHSSSIIVCYHGAAMANLPFMRRHAVYIDISPYKQRHMFINYMMRSWAPLMGLKFLQYDVKDPFQVVMDWGYIFKTPLWQGMTPEQKVKYVETRECPSDAECLVSWRNWKAQGAMVDFGQMEGLLQAGAAWLKTVTKDTPGDMGTAAAKAPPLAVR